MSKLKSTARLFPIVVNPKIDEYASQYKLCVQKTATSILELAYTVKEARDHLNYDDFAEFKKAIGATSSKDSYIKKLLMIAKAHSRLDLVKDKLPPNYTTLYELAKMPTDSFQKVCDDEVLSPNMTAKNFKSYLAVKVNNSLPAEEALLSFKNVSQTQKQHALTKLNELCIKFNIELKTKMILPSLIKSSNLIEVEDVVDKVELLAA